MPWHAADASAQRHAKAPCHHSSMSQSGGAPQGDVYERYQRANELLASGDAAAAAILLEWVVEEEPDARSVREALARAYFDSRRNDEARDAFHHLVESAPDDDYAHFGLGMTLWRTGQFARAEEHLGMAAAMRPDRRDYVNALGQVRATLRARAAAGLPQDRQEGEHV